MNECNTYSEIFNFNLKESQITDVLFVGPWLCGQGVVAWGVPNGNSGYLRVHAHAHVEIMKIFSVFFRESLVKDRFQQRGIILKIYTLKWFPALGKFVWWLFKILLQYVWCDFIKLKELGKHISRNHL